MKNKAIIRKHPELIVSAEKEIRSLQSLVDYYEVSGPDYAIWSKNFNMHYGYLKKPCDIFFRERMLENMSDLVFDTMDLSHLQGAQIADMGCGVGAITRRAAERFPGNTYHGISIVPWQIQQAQKMTTTTDSIRWYLEDFTATSFIGNTVDRVFAIESACHSEGEAKSAFLEESFRILRPGGKIVIADGFLKNPGTPLSPLFDKAHKSLCKHWAIPQLAVVERFVEEMNSIGFNTIKISDISWRVAPSVAYAPWLVLRFLIKARLKNKPLKTEQWNNVKGVLLSVLLGLNRHKFSYYLISAEK